MRIPYKYYESHLNILYILIQNQSGGKKSFPPKVIISEGLK
jgi:hypothetical protein